MPSRNEKWLINLVDGLDRHLDEETRARILEQCGRQCQSQSFVKKARGIFEKSNDVNDFLERFQKVYKHLHRDGNEIYIVYPKCYCPMVNKIPKGKLSWTHCDCSKGWAKALFEGALGRPVQVIKKETIIHGDKQCKFQIIV